MGSRRDTGGGRVESLLQQILEETRRSNRERQREERGAAITRSGAATARRSAEPSGNVASAASGGGQRGSQTSGGRSVGEQIAPRAQAGLVSVISQIKGVLESGFRTESSVIASSNPLESQAVVNRRAELEGDLVFNTRVQKLLALRQLGTFTPSLGIKEAQEGFRQAGQTEREFRQATLEVAASQKAVEQLRGTLNELAFATQTTVPSAQIQGTLDQLTQRNLVVQAQERELLKAAEARQLEVYNRPEVRRAAGLFE